MCPKQIRESRAKAGNDVRRAAMEPGASPFLFQWAGVPLLRMGLGRLDP